MSKGAQTRKVILQVAFELTYRNGYQNTSIDDILKKTHVTKGSFFYHFKNKDQMGLAMVDEILYPGMKKVMIEPLLDSNKPIEELKAMMKGLLFANSFFDIRYGCPAVNLIQEMASVSKDFNTRLKKLSNEWKKAISAVVDKARENNTIDRSHKSEDVALYIIAGYGGVRNLGKLYGKGSYDQFYREFVLYLEGL
ncbi:MAG: TetR/AcrR family transcriptional regulator [Bacteroidia bacterium]|nr:TetR/AcrR family transcriptional regulator [Bacteroidia bacterium]